MRLDTFAAQNDRYLLGLVVTDKKGQVKLSARKEKQTQFVTEK